MTRLARREAYRAAGRALAQYLGGRQGPGNVTEVGWNRGDAIATGQTHEYKLNVPITQGTFLTATLTWDRIVTETNAGGAAGDGKMQSTDGYSAVAASHGVADSNLFVYKGEQLVASSVASNTGVEGDNIEHLYFPVPAAGVPGDYRIVVKATAGVSATVAAPPYALAWQTTAFPVVTTTTNGGVS